MSAKEPEATVAVDRLTGFYGPDLHDLCDAAEAAILHGGGFGWLSPPPRQAMEAYWQGVLLVPERELFVGRLDGTRSEEHTSELQSLMRIPYAVFRLKKKTT